MQLLSNTMSFEFHKYFVKCLQALWSCHYTEIISISVNSFFSECGWLSVKDVINFLLFSLSPKSDIKNSQDCIIEWKVNLIDCHIWLLTFFELLCILSFSDAFNTCLYVLCDSFAASLSLNAIYDEVIKKEGGLGMNLERIRASLVQLGCEMPMIQIDETYSIGTVPPSAISARERILAWKFFLFREVLEYWIFPCIP